MALRSIILHNFWAKAGSVLLAAMIWQVINTWQQGGRMPASKMTTEVVPFYNHPITMMESAADQQAYRVTPATANITLRGPAEAVRQLRNTDIVLYVNLVDAGNTTKLRKRVLVHHPAGLTVIKIDPFEVAVERLE
jgi:hypothetical protein